MAAPKDLARRSSEFAEARKLFSSKISRAQRRDKRDAIEAVAQEMEVAAMKHDAKGVWQCVSRLWRGWGPPAEEERPTLEVCEAGALVRVR